MAAKTPKRAKVEATPLPPTQAQEPMDVAGSAASMASPSAASTKRKAEQRSAEKKRTRVKVTLETVLEPEDAHTPIGPYLVPVPAPRRDEFESGKLAFSAFKRDDGSSAQDRLLVADLDKTEYHASNFGLHAQAASGLANYAVGVYDRTTKTVKIVDAAVMGLKIQVKALHNEQLPKTNAQQSYFAAKNLLGETFGTKKVKQAIRAVERNQVDVKTLMPLAGVLEDAIASKSEEIPSMADLAREMEEDRPIPPFNVDAESAADVYNIDDIITPDESLQLPIKPLIKMTADDIADWRQKRRFPEYVLNHLERLLGEPKRNKSQLRKLLYLSYLMRFRGGRRFDDEDRVNFQLGGDVPKTTMTRLYETFLDRSEDASTGNVTYMMSPRKKDLLTSYLLVLCLFIEGDFTVDPIALVKDLKLERTRIINYLRNLGCTLISAAGRVKTEDSAAGSTEAEPHHSANKIARLQLPLNFPKPKRGPVNKR